MGSKPFSEALDAAGKRLRKESKFKIKSIIIRGEIYEPLVPEDKMLRILHFKGTGEKRKFLDLIKEVEQKWIDEWIRVLDDNNDDDFNPTNAPWLDEYIIQNNFQVIYEQGDIVIKAGKC